MYSGFLYTQKIFTTLLMKPITRLPSTLAAAGYSKNGKFSIGRAIRAAVPKEENIKPFNSYIKTTTRRTLFWATLTNTKP